MDTTAQGYPEDGHSTDVTPPGAADVTDAPDQSADATPQGDPADHKEFPAKACTSKSP